MCDSTCRKRPEQADPQREEVGLWCQGPGGRGMTYWGGVSLWGDGDVPNLDKDDCSTALWILK